METKMRKTWIEPAAHITFWVGLILLMLDTEENQLVVERVGQPEQFVSNTLLFGLTYLISALIFYGNVLVLYPRIFKKKRYASYALLLIGWVLLLFLAEYLYLNSLLDAAATGVYTKALVNHGVFILFSLLYVLIKNLVELTSQQRSIRENQLVDELIFLKSQLNPHFLFNTINNIFSMAQKNQDDEVANYLSDLSKIMRYSLYESNEFKVSLEKELNFLRSYIQMSMLKYTAEDLDLTFEIQGEHTHQQIAPLLLVPLVENAFKHGPIPGKRSQMHILVNAKGNGVEMQVMNSYNGERKSGQKNVGGIGIKNLRRRLELLYADHHSFEIKQDEKWFEVSLKIQLSE